MIRYDQNGASALGGNLMRRTIYLPDEFGKRVEAYLREHPDVSLSTLVREALEERLTPPDPRAILELAGLVSQASTAAGLHAEDRFVRRER
jgi:hypothetical protein